MFLKNRRDDEESWQVVCTHSYKSIALVAILILFSSCIGKNNIEVTLKNPTKTGSPNVTVSNIQVVNHQIIITGTNLNAVSNFKIMEGATTTNLQIESIANTSIIANTISNVTFAAGRVFDFVLSNASASATFTVNFSLCDSTLGTKGFNCSITPNDKEVLSYDAVSGKWKPRSVNGLSYQGTWDATGAPPAAVVAGEYYIVSVAGSGYLIGDWAVFNGAGFDKVANSTVITNVFGRTGAVAATKGDYVLTKMGDVDLTTTPPITGDILKYDGTNWVPGVVAGGGGGTVTTVSGTAPISVATGTSTPVVSISQATGAANGYLSSADWTTFNNKQAGITAAATTTYFRGDKTFVTLDTSVVPENTNLYFTNARVLGVALTGFDNTLTGQIAATDTTLQAFGRTQNQINSLTTGGANYLIKNGPDTLSGAVSLTNVITASGAGDIIVGSPLGLTSAINKAYADGKLDKTTGGTVAGVVTLDNDLKIKGGANYVTLKGHAASATYNFILPSSAGTSGYVLQTDGAGNLSWINPSTVTAGTGTVTSASIVDGTIVDVDINASAAIAQSKIANLTTDLGNKVSTTLANGNVLVGSAGNIATAVAVSGDATIINTGAVTLKNTGTAGTYTSVTTDAQGRVTGGTNPTVVTSVTGTAPVNVTATATPVVSMAAATTAVDGYLTSTDWNTFNNKQAAISKTTTHDISKLRVYGANATNYVEIGAQALGSNITFNLPTSNGTPGFTLQTDGSGNTSWVAVASAPVTSVNTLTGAVVLTTTNVAEGTSLYHTDARVLSTPITAPTLTNSTIATSDTVQVSLGKLQGQLNNKEGSLTAGATSQYYRGDKSWQTLDSSIVTENTNLYFTNARVLGVALTGFVTTDTTAIVATDTMLQAIGKTQGQLNNKLSSASFIDWSINGVQTIHPSRLTLGVGSASKATVTDGSGFIVASATTSTELGYLSGVTSAIQTQLNTKQATILKTTVQDVSALRVYGANATNYVEINAPALAGNLSFILPSTIGSTGQVLKTDGAGNLSWASVSTLAPVTSVNTQTGAVVLTTTNIAEGTSLYYTTARVATDALATLIAGLSTATNSAITAADSILIAFGKLQAQITSLGSTKLNLTGGTMSVGTIDGIPNPTTANQVANKAYVDSSVSSPSVTCPTGYVLVPANTTYFPKQFCVMKYAASNDGYGTAVSVATNVPWVSIPRTTNTPATAASSAVTACQALGQGYNLISNDQYQTIARNIAGVASNWSTGTVASGELSRGHSDNAPASALAASTDDVNGNCAGETNQTCTSTTWHNQRRTHVLSNGNMVWDFAGNVWEWVTNDNNVVNGADGYISTMSGADIRQTRYGALSSTICAAPGASPYCGMGYGYFNYSAGAVFRGGIWDGGVLAGVFAAHLGGAPSGVSAAIGFRCVFVP